MNVVIWLKGARATITIITAVSFEDPQ